jgi:hypothetical protein
MSDLKSKIDFLRNHPDQAKKIAQNALSFAADIDRGFLIQYSFAILNHISKRFE